MKITIRTIWVMLWIVMTCQQASAVGPLNLDSLKAELELLPDSTRLQRLEKLASQYARKTRTTAYIELLLSEAIKQRSSYYRGSALFWYANYYYLHNPDSMRYYMRLAEPILLSDDRIEEMFRMRGWNIYSLSSEGKRDSVISEVEEMRILADKYDYPDGKDMANQSLANFYISTGLPEEGIKLYEEVLDGMEKRNVPLVRRIYVLRQLLNRESDSEKRLGYLSILDRYIRECEEKAIFRLDESITIDYLKYLYHRTYAAVESTDGNPSQMLYHLKIADQSEQDNGWEKNRSTMDQLWLFYYSLTNNFEKGLPLADKLIDYFGKHHRITDYLAIMKQKSILLYNQGRGIEAMNVYRQYIAQRDSITNAKYYSDLAELRTQHDLDALELRNQKMELQATETHFQLVMMGGGILFLVLACILFMFIAYSRHKYGVQLKMAKDKAEEADRLKSAFLANMNHEIRTPLNAIVGFSQVLIDEEDQDARKQFAGIIQSNNDLLQRLIADVLDISKIESNSISLHFDNHDLPVLMSEIYNVILLRMHDGVELQLEECQPYVFYTDRNRLTQILTNLLTNAIKHTKAGCISFGYKVTSSEIRFFVQDTGEGIPPEQQEKIFSRFVQLDDWSKGVGLGLAICKGLVEKMGGMIGVTSKVGEGSVFFVRFPVGRAN